MNQKSFELQVRQFTLTVEPTDNWVTDDLWDKLVKLLENEKTNQTIENYNLSLGFPERKKGR